MSAPVVFNKSLLELRDARCIVVHREPDRRARAVFATVSRKGSQQRIRRYEDRSTVQTFFLFSQHHMAHTANISMMLLLEHTYPGYSKSQGEQQQERGDMPKWGKCIVSREHLMPFKNPEARVSSSLYDVYTRALCSPLSRSID